MAIGYVSKPGTEYGPCKSKCKHLDCKASRKTAACRCRFCGNEIGYDTGYFDEWYNQSEDAKQESGRYAFFIHARCLMRDAEQQRQKAAAVSAGGG